MGDEEDPFAAMEAMLGGGGDAAEEEPAEEDDEEVSLSPCLPLSLLVSRCLSHMAWLEAGRCGR